MELILIEFFLVSSVVVQYYNEPLTFVLRVFAEFDPFSHLHCCHTTNRLLGLQFHLITSYILCSLTPRLFFFSAKHLQRIFFNPSRENIQWPQDFLKVFHLLVSLPSSLIHFHSGRACPWRFMQAFLNCVF